jgi:hypothetical protein
VTKLATGEPADPSWRVTLHFHPDRLAAGTPILERMARDGVYRSQFETGTSNGGLTAYPDGDRWRWESRIFAGAYVHGVVDLTRDVEALVLDPCYRDTPVQAAASRLPCPVEWHGGFTLTTTELRRHPGYRGPEFVALGLALARHGVLDPGVIGNASRTGRYHEQHLKRVWHYVARFGTPEYGPNPSWVHRP